MTFRTFIKELRRAFYTHNNPECFIDRPLVYLACPYSDNDSSVVKKRFEASVRAAGKLMNDGHNVFSPITHCHPIAETCGLPLDWKYWEEFDRAYLACSYKVVVLRLEGWQESKGVRAEIAIAEELGLDVEYMDPV